MIQNRMDFTKNMKACLRGVKENKFPFLVSTFFGRPCPHGKSEGFLEEEDVKRVLGPHSRQSHEVARRLGERALAHRRQEYQHGDHEAVAEVLPQGEGVRWCRCDGFAAPQVGGVEMFLWLENVNFFPPHLYITGWPVRLITIFC